MVFNLVTKPHSKHTNICYYGIHELVVKGKVELSFIDNAKKSHQSPHQEIHKVQSSIGLTVSLWQLLAPLRFSALHAAQWVGVLKMQSTSVDRESGQHHTYPVKGLIFRWEYENAMHELRYVDAEKLNCWIKCGLWGLCGSAPLEWTWDGFLFQNVLISVVVQYGQNQLIRHHQDREREKEREHWDHLHKNGNIQTVTVVLATHSELSILFE